MPLALSSLERIRRSKMYSTGQTGRWNHFAQDESSVLFYGMPSSAIRTGCVNFVLNPGNIALELISIRRYLDSRGTSPGC
jgi:chemotaxis response regulator CheB